MAISVFEASDDHEEAVVCSELGEHRVMTVEEDAVLLLRLGVALGRGEAVKTDPAIGMPITELIGDGRSAASPQVAAISDRNFAGPGPQGRCVLSMRDRGVGECRWGGCGSGRLRW
jgi:hypothetical protein